VNNRGVTLIELLIARRELIVKGYWGVPIIIINEIDIVGFDEDKMEQLFVLGTLEIKNSKVSNTISNRSYSGTGNAFYKDMEGSIGNRIIPVNPEAKNDYNKTNDNVYKFWFDVESDIVNIFYFDKNMEMVIIAVVNLP